MPKAATRPHNRRTAPPANQPRLWNIRNAANGAVPVIELFGDIGVSREGDPWWGIEGGAGTFQEFAAELRALGPCPNLRVEIHSYGGSVIVGKGIHDKLLEHPANKTAVIYGVCASAATYAALACQTVQIPANSFFLIHNSTGFCFGNAADMQRVTDNLEICDESIAALYAARTGKSVDEIRQIMDEDTWMTGTAAVEMGLADEVIEPITIDRANLPSPENFRPQILNSMPAAARVWFDMRASPNPQPANNTMLRPNTPLFNAAVDTPPAGGGAAPVVTPPAAAPTPVNAAPPVVAPVVAPVVPPVTAPANAAPLTLADIQTAITNAVAPLQAEVTRLSGLQAAGITPQNLAGAQPAAIGAPPVEGTAGGLPQNATPEQVFAFGLRQAAKNSTVPPAVAG